MTSHELSLRLSSPSLSELLNDAQALVRRLSREHITQRGQTYSVNGVTLTWASPHHVDFDRLPWTRDDGQRYLNIFVDKNMTTDPLRERVPGELLFPYTYASRARYWDGGWAYLQTFLKYVDKHTLSLERASQSYAYFLKMVETLAEHMHIQTVLSIASLYSPHLLTHYLLHPEVVSQAVSSWQRDSLLAAIQDIGDNPHSRRAVVACFSYPQLEESLMPQMGRPPYQLFQLLPDDRYNSISSTHVHRSLDVVHGAPLDFLHDYSWLQLASSILNRPLGDITITANNLHEYVEKHDAANPDEIVDAPYRAGELEKWLSKVTDAYPAMSRLSSTLLDRSGVYAANANRIFKRWSAGG